MAEHTAESLLHKKTREVLAKQLMPGEEVLGALPGHYKQAIVLTSQRVLVIKPGMMAGAAFGARVTSFNYSAITGLDVQTDFSRGVVEVLDPSHQGRTYRSGQFGDFWRSAAELPNCIPCDKATATSPVIMQMRQFITNKARSVSPTAQSATATAPAEAAPARTLDPEAVKRWADSVAEAGRIVGLEEKTRMTGPQLRGRAVEGDVQLVDDLAAPRFSCFVTLFGNHEDARQTHATLLTAVASWRNAVSNGTGFLQTVGPILFCAETADPSDLKARLDQVVQAVSGVELPSKIAVTGSQANAAEDPLIQLKRLGELHQAGVLTDAEFESKKSELLGRI